MNKIWPDTTTSDNDDNVIGPMQLYDAFAAHRNVRVAHVFVVNSKGEMLLQLRGPNVIAPNLWNAAAAGHVDWGDTYEQTAVKELHEEMGITCTEDDLEFIGKIHHPVKDEKNGDHAKFHVAYVVESDDQVTPEPSEVAGHRWVSMDELKSELSKKPGDFTEPFVILAKQYFEQISS